MSQDGVIRSITMGRVRGVHGVRGLVKVESFTDPVEQLLEYRPWQILVKDASTQAGGARTGGTVEPDIRELATTTVFEIESGQRHGRGLLVKLSQCESREQAQRLVGCEIQVDYAQLPAPEENEFYWIDLEGLEVKTRQGDVLGRVAYLFETGANDVIVVSGERERMLPYIDDVVRDIDLEAGVITVDWDPQF